MPIETSGSVATTSVPPGTQTEFLTKKASFDAKGKYGPSVELDMILADEQFYGTQLRYWARVQQPRMDLVRKWRGDGMSDEVIKTALKERGFKFKKIDEEDRMVVGRNGNLFKILTAIAGSPKAADAVLADCDSFDELAERFVGGRFIGTTKQNANGYVGLDGREEIFPVASRPATGPASEPADNADPGATDSDEDFEDIPL